MKHFLWVTLIFSLLLIACQPSPGQLSGGLTLEEHELSQPPSSDQFEFQPIEASMDVILARHKDERELVTPVTYFTAEGNPALKAPWGDDELIAVLVSNANMEQTIQVSRQDEIIFSTPAGMPSPVVPLQELWTYDDHWALEVLYATPTAWEGQIFIDGRLVNEDKNYEEAFGFQMLADKPFFFYQRNGQIGISYDGQEADLGYTSIPHYLCCAESVQNPVHAENMVVFFAQREQTWYYVELGRFK